jgi:hypothetical protein
MRHTKSQKQWPENIPHYSASLTFYLPSVNYYSVFLHSHILSSSCSSTFWCLSTLSSGIYTPTTIGTVGVKVPEDGINKCQNE